MSGLFHMWAPFDVVEKSDNDSGKRGRIHGIASTEVVDADNEVILQKGLDFSDTKWLTLEHPCGVINIVGEPISFESTVVKGHEATALTGDLFLTDPMGAQIFEKARALKKADSKTRLGFSIEGQALHRDGNKITKAKIHSVAISSQPKNPLSLFDPVMASMFANLYRSQAGYPTQGMPAAGSFGHLVPQSFQGGSTSTANVEAEGVSKESEGKTFMDAMGMSNKDLAIAKLVKSVPGLDWDRATMVIDKMQALLRLR